LVDTVLAVATVFRITAGYTPAQEFDSQEHDTNQSYD